MNREQLSRMWDHLRKTHGIGVRLVQAIPADRIDAHPIPNMRTPKELVVHMYTTIFREMAEGVLRGEIRDTESTEKTVAAGIKTHADLVTFVTDSWKAADVAVKQITDAQLTQIVKTPWNFDAPGFVMFGAMKDEYLHHRGQLYAFVRALGAEPPMMWDFANNAEEYRPHEEASSQA